MTPPVPPTLVDCYSAYPTSNNNNNNNAQVLQQFDQCLSNNEILVQQYNTDLIVFNLENQNLELIGTIDSNDTTTHAHLYKQLEGTTIITSWLAAFSTALIAGIFLYVLYRTMYKLLFSSSHVRFPTMG
jgi:hypothetical protein